MQVVVQCKHAWQPGVCFFTIYFPVYGQGCRSGMLCQHLGSPSGRSKQHHLLSEPSQCLYQGTCKPCLACSGSSAHNHCHVGVAVCDEVCENVECLQLVGCRRECQVAAHKLYEIVGCHGCKLTNNYRTRQVLRAVLCLATLKKQNIWLVIHSFRRKVLLL